MKDKSPTNATGVQSSQRSANDHESASRPVVDRRAILGFALGPVGVGLISFISLPVMTWIFPPDMIGKLSMLQVAIGFTLVACSLGLDQAYAREYHESSNRAGLFLHALLPGLVLLISALILLVTISPYLLSTLLFGVQSVGYSILVSGCLVAAFITLFLSMILRMQDRGLAYSISQMLSKLLLLLIVLGYIVFLRSRTFTMLLAAQGVALLVTLVAFAWSTRADVLAALRASFDPALLRALTGFGLPLAAGGIATWGIAALDRVFLRSVSTYEDLAIYSVAASIASGVTILAGIFNTIWAPMVYRWVAHGLDAVERVADVAKQASVIMVILLCLLGGSSWLLAYALPPAYDAVPFLVVGCMIAPMLYTLSEITGIGVAISRRTGFSLVASGSAVVVNFGLCFVLVPALGARGAVIATATTFWLFFILRTEFSALVWHRTGHTRAHGYVAASLVAALLYATLGARAPWLGIAGWWILLGLVTYHHRWRVSRLTKELIRGFRARWLAVDQ